MSAWSTLVRISEVFFAPEVVFGLEVLETQMHNATLRWRAPSFDGGSAITSYKVSYNGTDVYGGSVPSGIIWSNTSGTTLLVEGLQVLCTEHTL